MNDNDYLFFTTEKHVYRWGDPNKERTVRVVVLRRWTFVFTFIKQIRKVNS